jgi:hypothetical protein
MAKTDENRLGILEQREYWVNLSKFKVDYAVNRPRIVDELNIKAPDVIRKVARITWDGKQFSIRIPKEISEELKLTSDDKVVFTLTKPLPDTDERPVLKVEMKHD